MAPLPTLAATAAAPATGRPASPVTGGEVTLETRMPSAAVVALYREQLGVDVGAAFHGVPEIELWRCQETGYRFFTPWSVAGDHAFYRRLGREAWYYLRAKWEHRFVADHLPHGARVLEVGSGAGAFLELLRRRGMRGTGLEWNDDAVGRAAARGLDVRARELADVALDQAGAFDAVCLFQVLEHVPAVSGFLRHCLRALRGGGLLCIAVPDQESFVGRLELALDLPPHHMGRWTRGALLALAAHLGLEVVSLCTEPLQRAHLKSYWHELLQRRCGRPAGRLRGLARWTFPLVRPALELGRRALRGHSVVAVLRSAGPR
jgi:SAM-dependent methyltransferase